MKAVFFLDIGHRDKGGPIPDPGASSGAFKEVPLATAYATHAAEVLRAAGHAVEMVPEGPYSSRHAWAIRRAAEAYPGMRGLYLQCHLNAGKGRYALVRPDYRSKWGAQAARLLTTALDLGLAEVVGSRSDELYPSAKAAAAAGRSTSNKGLVSWWTRGWECLDGIYEAPTLCGAIVEAGFIDAPEHAALWQPDGLKRVGAALAAGCLQWAETT